MNMNSFANDPNVALLSRARHLIEKGELQEAALTLNEARAQIPDDPRVFMMAGLMAEKAGNVLGAFQLMIRGTQIAPKWGPGFAELAQLHARQKQGREARESAKKAAALSPKDKNVLDSLATTAKILRDYTMAAGYFRKILALHPEDAMVQRQLAACLDKVGTKDEALDLLNKIISRHPDDEDSLLGRAQILLQVGRLEEAAGDTARLLALRPDNATYAFYDSLTHGQTPSRKPAALTQAIFDEYAQDFDYHLMNKLEYRLPQLVATEIATLYPGKKLNLLDLGCGTGLLGAHMGRIDGQLTGVDVSPKMIEQAKRLKLYDDFHTVDLESALRKVPNGFYHAATALDVFIYIGKLNDIITACANLLPAGGHLIFSCETASEEGPDFVLPINTYRYQHKRSHVEAMCQRAGFSLAVQEVGLRLEKGHKAPGFLVTATRLA